MGLSGDQLKSIESEMRGSKMPDGSPSKDKLILFAWETADYLVANAQGIDQSVVYTRALDIRNALATVIGTKAATQTEDAGDADDGGEATPGEISRLRWANANMGDSLRRLKRWASQEPTQPVPLGVQQWVMSVINYALAVGDPASLPGVHPIPADYEPPSEIFINGRRIPWIGKTATYAQIVASSGIQGRPDVLYMRPLGHGGGSMTPGKTIEVTNGMFFDVSHTNQA